MHTNAKYKNPKTHIGLAYVNVVQKNTNFILIKRGGGMFNHRHLQHFISVMLVGIYGHHIFDSMKYTLCRIKLNFNVHSGLTLHSSVKL